MLYDLHTHSNCSDGELSPRELVQLARQNGVGVLALTDHDTLAGVREAQAEAGNSLTLIPGIEFSAVWQGVTIHLVGLRVDITSAELQQAVNRQGQLRQQRAVTIAAQLARMGIDGALEGARHYAGRGTIGRPHFARYLLAANHVSTFAEAFNQYLGSGKPGDVKHPWPAIETVVSWINGAGGIAVLAHPDKYKLTRTRLYTLLNCFVAAGGRAIEVVSGQQQAEVTARLLRAAQDHSLLASCGSDFHHPGTPGPSPGKLPPLPKNCHPVLQAW